MAASSADEYERIVRRGSLNDPERVELIDGYTGDEKMPKSTGALTTSTHERRRLRLSGTSAAPGGHVESEGSRCGSPIHDEPEPDVSVVRGPRAGLTSIGTPAPPIVSLLVEVS